MRKILFPILILFLGFAGCKTSNETMAKNDYKYSFLALGDSYTIGESVDRSLRWPVQLVSRLNDRGCKVAPPKIIAKTGWTTEDLLSAMREQLNYTREFDFISISIGVNNQYQGGDIEEYEDELREIFKMALNYSKKREKAVFALSIPDYSVTPFGADNAKIIREEINQYNAVFKKVAADFEVDFYNITPISREAARNLKLIAEDDLHPSGLMYQYWVDAIIDEIPQMLPEK